MAGLLFDLDDTLYPRERFVASGFAAVARYLTTSWRADAAAVEVTLQAAHAAGQIGREFQVVCAAHRLPLSAVPAMLDVFRSHVPDIALAPEVRDVLVRLARDGWRLGLLTNGDPAVQRRKVQALGLEALMRRVIYAEEHHAAGKPHPSVFLAALDALRLRPEECVHVGDDLICDIAGARALGIRTIRITTYLAATGDAAAPNDSGLQPDATIHSLSEVPKAAASLVRETPRVA